MFFEGMQDLSRSELQAIDVECPAKESRNNDRVASFIGDKINVIGAYGYFDRRGVGQRVGLWQQADFSLDSLRTRHPPQEIAAAHELGYEACGWVVEDFLWRANLFDLSILKDCQPVSHEQGFFLVVSDKHDRRPRGF